MSLKSGIKSGFRLLANSKKELEKLKSKSLEEVIDEYLKVLLLSGLFAAVIGFAFRMLRGVYLDLVANVDVNYWILLNYVTSLTTGTFMFYLFSGTVLFAVLNFILRIFIKINYIDMVKLMMMSLMPVLLFGWIAPGLAIALLVWSIYLFVLGVRIQSSKSSS